MASLAELVGVALSAVWYRWDAWNSEGPTSRAPLSALHFSHRCPSVSSVIQNQRSPFQPCEVSHGARRLTVPLAGAYYHSMNCAPLRFPPQWPDICRRSFLLGFPLIGPQAGAYDDICTQLSQRTPDCWSTWGPDKARLEAARFVARTVAEAVEWPNPIFVPDDPYDLVFWDHKSCVVDDLSLIDALMEIDGHFHANPSEDEMGMLAAGTLGPYIDYLLTQAQKAR